MKIDSAFTFFFFSFSLYSRHKRTACQNIFFYVVQLLADKCLIHSEFFSIPLIWSINTNFIRTYFSLKFSLELTRVNTGKWSVGIVKNLVRYSFMGLRLIIQGSQISFFPDFIKFMFFLFWFSNHFLSTINVSSNTDSFQIRITLIQTRGICFKKFFF